MNMNMNLSNFRLTHKVLKLEAEKVDHVDYITIQRDEANEIQR